MGQQQLLLIILGVIIVGIAIAVGISMFSSGSVQANRDGIVNDLNNLAANDGRIGVTWPFVVRKALQATTLAEAKKAGAVLAYGSFITVSLNFMSFSIL